MIQAVTMTKEKEKKLEYSIELIKYKECLSQAPYVPSNHRVAVSILNSC